MNELTEEMALRAYARMINTLSADDFVPLLADDFHYESGWVFQPMTSAEEFVEYITAKLETFRKAGECYWAEMAWYRRPCVVVARGDPDNLQATVTAKVRDGKIIRIDLHFIPPPHAVFRLRDYPV